LISAAANGGRSLISEAAKCWRWLVEAGHAERVHPAFIDVPPGETMPHRCNWKRPSLTKTNDRKRRRRADARLGASAPYAQPRLLRETDSDRA
jgi:hypothetical protein